MSNATTHLLDGMHHRSLLRVARRESGTRVYDAVERAPVDDSSGARGARAQALVDLEAAWWRSWAMSARLPGAAPSSLLSRPSCRA